jgi:hypothetical protein
MRKRRFGKKDINKYVNYYKNEFNTYIMILNDEAQKYIPIALKRLKKSGRVHVEQNKTSIIYNVSYARKQYYESLRHLTPSKKGDMRSISSLFTGARQYRLNMLTDQLAKIEGNSKTAERRRESKQRAMDRIKRASDFNYGLGYKVLTGNPPKWALDSKFSRKRARMSKFSTMWIDRAIAEIGTFSKWKKGRK